MSEREKPEQTIQAPREKVYWPLYGLQSLPPDKFSFVVAEILSGRYAVIAQSTASQIIASS